MFQNILYHLVLRKQISKVVFLNILLILKFCSVREHGDVVRQQNTWEREMPKVEYCHCSLSTLVSLGGLRGS